MIPPDLLFQTDMIRTIFSLSLGEIGGMALCIFLIVYAISSFRQRSTLSKIQSVPQISTLPEISDPHFEGKISSYLRARIGYPRGEPRAHTAREIAGYRSAHPLYPILEEVERIEYTLGSIAIVRRGEMIIEIQRRGGAR